MHRRKDGRETWNRLLGWDKGQAPSERLAALILKSEGYKSIDPSHPLGGKDGCKDALVEKDNLKLVMGVYFPRNQQQFNTIKKKFLEDFGGVVKNNAEGFVFVTNQELRLAERTKLNNLGMGIPTEIFHLERNSSVLNYPLNYGIRLEFLDITMTKEEMIAFYQQRDISHLNKLEALNESLNSATEKLIGFTTGGDSVPLFFFNSYQQSKKLLRVTTRIEGEYPIFDATVDLQQVSNIQFIVKGKIDDRLYKKHIEFVNKTFKSFQIGTISPEYAREVGLYQMPESLPKEIMISIYSRTKVFRQFVLIGDLGNGKIGTISSYTSVNNKNIHKWKREDSIQKFTSPPPQ